MDKIKIGSQIKEVRKLNELSQVEFAAKIGVSQGNLSEIETGRLFPSLDTIIKIVDTFNLDINWLIKNGETQLNAICLNQKEEKLIHVYRQLQNVAKDEVFDFIQLKLKRYSKA